MSLLKAICRFLEWTLSAFLRVVRATFVALRRNFDVEERTGCQTLPLSSDCGV